LIAVDANRARGDYVGMLIPFALLILAAVLWAFVLLMLCKMSRTAGAIIEAIKEIRASLPQ
jgi:hypothetical protein